jgi:hypothetical protein
MSHGETWMWLTDSGASHHITSICGDFFEHYELIARLRVKGIRARAIGVGSVRIIVKAESGDDILAALSNVLHVPELSVVRYSLHHSCRALEVQRNDDEEDNTPNLRNPYSRNLCGEEPDTSLGESPLKGNAYATGVG